MEQIYLSRRNLETLLNKLDRVRQGEESTCTIVKNDTVHPKYACSTQVMVTAVEDEVYYQDRKPGRVFPGDDKKRERAEWVQ